MTDYLTPKIGQHRINDMLSEATSLETKASTARWYAEMMIDLFLSKEVKCAIGEEDFYKLTLSEKIKGIKPFFSEQIIDSLQLIRNFGNKAAHYNPNVKIRETDVKKIVEKALTLFDLLLVNLLKDGGYEKTEYTPKIFSTFLPSIRCRVLNAIVDLNSVCCKDDIGDRTDILMVHKLLLAYVKNGERKKAINVIKKLKKKNSLNSKWYSRFKKAIDVMDENVKKNILPIPRNIHDCKRNFDDVMKDLSDEEKFLNKELIDIFNIMLQLTTPSELGELQPNELYLIADEV